MPISYDKLWKLLIDKKMNRTDLKDASGISFNVLAKMLIDGYIIKVDYTEQKKLAAAVSRIAANINHVCRRINSTGHVYEDDVAELKARQAEIWELLKMRQRDEL